MSMMDRTEEFSDRDGDDRKGGKGGRGGFTRRKLCRFCGDEALTIDYKNTQMIRSFVTERGKLIPRRINGNCSRHQRAVALAVRRARMIALVPFTVTGR
jgi:small subunit ribosomal protein S18